MPGPSPEEAREGFADADAAYEAIRASTHDVVAIAGATGWKRANVQTCKDHVFYQPHLLDRYEHLGIPAEMRRFDSSNAIAAAWARLQQSGKFTPADLQLMRHEMAEAWYMRQHGPSYTAAHEKAQARFPWPLG